MDLCGTNTAVAGGRGKIHPMLATSTFTNALVTAIALAAACSVLSVIVVLRRWAFIGEGISHAGFGGIGTGWLLSLALPAFGNAAAAYAVAVLFCIAIALSIGYISRDYLAGKRVSSDSAIGIFLVASLAWGILALKLYEQRYPNGGGAWENYLFGDISFISRQTMLAGLCISAAVIVIIAALGKEILSYTFDPMLARVGGVPVSFIHYLLMILLALTIIIGMKLAGNVLVTALLVLPGATALLLSHRLAVVMGISVVVGWIGAVGGLMLNHRLWPFIPSGPAIVLVLFWQFVGAYVWAHLPRKNNAN